MKENLSLEKVNLILELLKNITKEEWQSIKEYIDNNFEKFEEMNTYQLRSKNKFIQIRKELLNLENKSS